MTEHRDRQRIRPTAEGRARLLAAIQDVAPPHVVDSGTLGEYAELVAVRGRAEADVQMPAVATHLADGCVSCTDDVRELSALLGAPDPPELVPAPQPQSGQPVAGDRPHPNPFPAGEEVRSSPSPTGADRNTTSDILPRHLIDSGIHAADLPDPHAAEAAALAQRQRLRKIRDWLLIASAISILLIGLSLVGMAYMASRQPPPRLVLTPLPGQSTGAGTPGRAAPSDTSCPAAYPIKGNRDSKIYHRPGGAFYDQTRPEDCFATPADAEAAGYRASQR